MDSAEVTELKRHMGVLVEGMDSRVRQLAEGQIHFDEKFDRRINALEEKIDRRFEETQAMIKFSYAELDRRIRALEDGHEQVVARLARLEAR